LAAFQLLLAGAVLAADVLELKDAGAANWGWKAFGHGVDDSGVKKSEDSFWVAVNWPNSTWGNGMFFKSPEGPIDATKYKKVAVKIRSQSPTQAKFRIELLTKDNAVYGSDPATPFTLREGEETTVVVEIASMVPVQAEQGQREFMPDEDLKKIDRVQILFLKPDDAAEARNVLSFKDIQLLP
jgi:hypothetical protein